MSQRRFEIARRIKIISNTFARNGNCALEEHNLTYAQRGIMLYLAECGHKVVHQKEIEEMFRLTNPTVTGILNRLEEKGLISRRIDAKDRRCRAVGLTPKGEEVLKSMGDALHHTEEQLFGCLDDGEEAKLLELLDKVASATGSWKGGCGTGKQHCPGRCGTGKQHVPVQGPGRIL